MKISFLFLNVLQEDPEADAKFIKIAKAYEILKDPESRKKYDFYGDTGEVKATHHRYRSYSYYTDEFGIYDEDPLIVTLSQADYGKYCNEKKNCSFDTIMFIMYIKLKKLNRFYINCD